jgi:hypothetical protein
MTEQPTTTAFLDELVVVFPRTEEDSDDRMAFCGSFAELSAEEAYKQFVNTNGVLFHAVLSRVII